MSSFRQVQVGEVTLRVALQGGGPLVVLVRGFPESWYSWRHQMGPIGGQSMLLRTLGNESHDIRVRGNLHRYSRR
jgi:hypothetical protein